MCRWGRVPRTDLPGRPCKTCPAPDACHQRWNLQSGNGVRQPSRAWSVLRGYRLRWGDLQFRNGRRLSEWIAHLHPRLLDRHEPLRHAPSDAPLLFSRGSGRMSPIRERSIPTDGWLAAVVQTAFRRNSPLKSWTSSLRLPRRWKLLRRATAIVAYGQTEATILVDTAFPPRLRLAANRGRP